MERQSAFGIYRGYSERRYDSVVRTSIHVPMGDGVRVAVDVYRPALGGVPAPEPLPVALQVTRYWRAARSVSGELLCPLGVWPARAAFMPLNDRPIAADEPVRPLHLLVQGDPPL